MNSFLLSGMIGTTLALLNFIGSLIYSSKIIIVSKVTSVALALAGFMGRLAILSLIFYGLSRVKGIHFQTALVSFILCFTLCLIFKTMFLYRKLSAFRQKSSAM